MAAQISNEDVFVAAVTVLSKMLDAEKREKGTRRVGGDYSLEAIQLIEQHRSRVLTLLDEIRSTPKR
jgi:ribosomal protein L18E